MSRMLVEFLGALFNPVAQERAPLASPEGPPAPRVSEARSSPGGRGGSFHRPLGPVARAAPGEVRSAGPGPGLPLKTGCFVSLLPPTHLRLLCGPVSDPVSTSPPAGGGHGDKRSFGGSAPPGGPQRAGRALPVPHPPVSPRLRNGAAAAMSLAVRGGGHIHWPLKRLQGTQGLSSAAEVRRAGCRGLAAPSALLGGVG